MSGSNDIRQLPDGTRISLIGREGHPDNGKQGTIIGALPNPSGRKENQWYDVRFEDYRSGRFNQRYLAHASATGIQEPDKKDSSAA
jgi:hypothetical protein